MVCIAVAIIGAFYFVSRSVFGELQERFDELEPSPTQSSPTQSSPKKQTIVEATPSMLLNKPAIIEATPAMLINININSDEKIKEKLVKQFVGWVHRNKEGMYDENLFFKDIDVGSLKKYSQLLYEQKLRLKEFDEHKCDAFKRENALPTRMNMYYDRPRLKQKAFTGFKGLKGLKGFRKRLSVCYGVYAPVSQVVRDDEKGFYDEFVRILNDASLISKDLELDPASFERLDTEVKNNFFHQTIQLVEECRQRVSNIANTLETEKLLEDTRILDYETDSVFIRPARNNTLSK